MNQQNNNMEFTTRKKEPKYSFDLSTMVYGKVPPQAKEIEEAVLGAIMLDSTAIGIAADILQPECFYADNHQRIFKAHLRLLKKFIRIDILVTVEELKISEELDVVGGPFAITKLTNTVVSTANLEAHCRIIFQKFLQREIIRIGGEMISEAYEDATDVFDLIDNSEGKISNLSITKQNKPYKSLQTVAEKTVDKIREIKNNKQELTGVPTGLSILDAITQGWQPTNLIILAARPAVGKSAVAGNLAIAAAASPFKPTPTGIFSLEMPSEQWVTRMISAATEIEQFDIKRGRISDEQMRNIEVIGLRKFASIPIFFDDSPSLNIYQFKSKARSMVLKEHVGLIIVDYLQLMSGVRANGENREQEVARISRELKQLAKELHIPIIALSQVGRKGESGDLTLSSLRESGAIEQDADDVIFLIPPSEEEIKANSSIKDNILIKIAKHRNGTTTEVDAFFVKEIQKIMSESGYANYLNKTTTLWNGAASANSNETKLYIQKGSKMNTGGCDEGFDEAAPF